MQGCERNTNVPLYCWRCSFVFRGRWMGVRRCCARSPAGWHSPARSCCAQERLTAGPASAASRQHPGNRRRSHEPGFPAQFISQPFWSPPCSLRTANPGGTRCPGCAGRREQRSQLGHRDTASPLVLCFFSGVITRGRHCFLILLPLYFFFFLFFTCFSLLPLVEKPGFCGC